MALSDALRSIFRRPTVSRRAVMTSMVLSIVFTIAVTIRAYAAKYGFYLGEFDPYYDYYAALHIVTLVQQHGLWYALFNNNTATCTAQVLSPTCHAQTGYFYWHDVQTWYPYGRNVAATSQDGLQIGGAFLYLLVHNVFGVQITLYDLLVLLPVFFGSITCVLFYFLVRKIAGDVAGLFAALVFAVSPPLIERGNLGWFKSEPMAIMLFVAASYLMLTVFDKERSFRSRFLRALAAGLLSGYANLAWGGGDYFSAAFGLMFIVIPFLSLEVGDFTPAMVSFTAGDLFLSAIFPRPGVHIITDPVGLALIGGTVFALLAQWAKTWAKPTEYRGVLFKFFFAFILGGLALISFGLVGGITERYLSVIAPWVRSNNPLAESVAEESVPAGTDYFTAYAVLLFFGMAGALMAFKRRSIPMIYALVFGLTGIYFSAAYSRLLVYSSISLGILGGIGFAELVFTLAKPSTTPLIKKKMAAATSRNEMKVVFSVAIIALIVIPAGTYWIPNPIQCTSAGQIFCDQSPADSAVSVANGATIYSRASISDWTQTLNWVSQDTPTNSIIVAWWDYGYWFAVMGNRTTVIDNATINSTQIAMVARLLMSNVTTAAAMAKRIGYDPNCNCTRPVYVAIFLTGSVLTTSVTGLSKDYYILQVPSGGGFAPGGGDESKKQWFVLIGGLPESNYIYSDGFNLTPYALNNTLFAALFPFKFSTFLIPETSNGQSELSPSSTYQTGTDGAPPFEAFTAGYTFPANDTTGPFRLAYASSSLGTLSDGGASLSTVPGATMPACPGNSELTCFNAILVYQLI